MRFSLFRKGDTLYPKTLTASASLPTTHITTRLLSLQVRDPAICYLLFELNWSLCNIPRVVHKRLLFLINRPYPHPPPLFSNFDINRGLNETREFETSREQDFSWSRFSRLFCRDWKYAYFLLQIVHLEDYDDHIQWILGWLQSQYYISYFIVSKVSIFYRLWLQSLDVSRLKNVKTLRPLVINECCKRHILAYPHPQKWWRHLWTTLFRVVELTEINFFQHNASIKNTEPINKWMLGIASLWEGLGKNQTC